MNTTTGYKARLTWIIEGKVQASRLYFLTLFFCLVQTFLAVLAKLLQILKKFLMVFLQKSWQNFRTTGKLLLVVVQI